MSPLSLTFGTMRDYSKTTEKIEELKLRASGLLATPVIAEELPDYVEEALNYIARAESCLERIEAASGDACLFSEGETVVEDEAAELAELLSYASESIAEALDEADRIVEEHRYNALEYRRDEEQPHITETLWHSSGAPVTVQVEHYKLQAQNYYACGDWHNTEEDAHYAAELRLAEKYVDFIAEATGEQAARRSA